MAEPVIAGRFAALSDCDDPVVVVEESDLLHADKIVLAILRNKGIDPDEVASAEGLDLLCALAVGEATARAAKRGAVEGDAALWKKYETYGKDARELSLRIDRESLGLAAMGSGAAGYGSIRIGRG